MAGLDPGTSDGGGEIVAAGPPEEIVREKRSYTGAFLKPVLTRGAGGKKRRVEAGRVILWDLVRSALAS